MVPQRLGKVQSPPARREQLNGGWDLVSIGRDWIKNASEVWFPLYSHERGREEDIWNLKGKKDESSHKKWEFKNWQN